MSVSDDFNRADGGFGSNWTTVAGSWSIVSNQGFEPGSGASASPVGIKWTANSWNNDQSSQITWKSTNNYVGPMVRIQGTSQATLNGYVYLSHGSLQRYDNGANTAILNAGVPQINKTFAVAAVGSGLEIFVDGASVGTTTDATYASGNAGIGAFEASGNLNFDDWLGTGEVATNTTITPGAGSISLTGYAALLLIPQPARIIFRNRNYV